MHRPCTNWEGGGAQSTPVLVPVLEAVALAVSFEVVLAAEGLGAGGAPVRPVPGMPPLVVQSVGGVLTAVAAVPALVTLRRPQRKAQLLGRTARQVVPQCDSLP